MWSPVGANGSGKTNFFHGEKDSSECTAGEQIKLALHTEAVFNCLQPFVSYSATCFRIFEQRIGKLFSM